MRMHILTKTMAGLFLLFLMATLCVGGKQLNGNPKPSNVVQSGETEDAKATPEAPKENQTAASNPSGNANLSNGDPGTPQDESGKKTDSSKLRFDWLAWCKWGSAILACLLGIGNLVLIIVGLTKIRKLSGEIVGNDTRKGKVTAILEKQDDLSKRFSEIAEKNPKEDSSASHEQEKLKSLLESLAEALKNPEPSKDMQKVLETVKGIKSMMENDLKAFQSEKDKLNEQKRDLEADKKEAKRKQAKADEQIAEYAKKVEEARKEMQMAMRQQFQATETRLNGEKSRLAELLGVSEREKAMLKAKEAQADASGYERGLNKSQEELREFARKNGALSEQLKSSLEKMGELQQKFTEADGERKNLRASLQNQEAIRENLRKECDRRIDEMKKSSEQQITSAQASARQQIAAAQESAKQQITSAQASAKQQIAAAQESAARLQQEKTRLEKEVEAERASVASLTSRNAEQAASLQEQETKIENLQKAVYPAEFLADPDFATLKEHLDSWISEQAAAAEIVKSSLGLFAQRAALNAETWQQALRNISVGITQTLQQRNEQPAAILTELVLWSRFLMKFSNENFDFSLKIPNIGDGVDPSWMSTGNSRTTRVSRIVSWAVWNNQFGVMHNAEVE